MYSIPAFLVVQLRIGRTGFAVIQEVIRRAGHDLTVVLLGKLRQDVLSNANLRLEGFQVETLAGALRLLHGRNRSNIGRFRFRESCIKLKLPSGRAGTSRGGGEFKIAANPRFRAFRGRESVGIFQS